MATRQAAVMRDRGRKVCTQTNTREQCAFIVIWRRARAYPPRSDVSRRRGRRITTAAGVGRRWPVVVRRHHELGRVDREGLLHDHGGAPHAPPRDELPGARVEPHDHSGGGAGPRLLRRRSLAPRRRHDAHLRHGSVRRWWASAAARARESTARRRSSGRQEMEMESRQAGNKTAGVCSVVAFD